VTPNLLEVAMSKRRRDSIRNSLFALLWLAAAPATRAAEAVSAEDWAFRYQRLEGTIQRTEDMIEMFEPESMYCEFPMRPSKADDLAILDAWTARMSQAGRDATSLERGIAEGLRNTPKFKEITGVEPEPHVFQKLRTRASAVQRAITAKKQAVERSPEKPCGKASPPPPPPAPPPSDPTAGLVPPVYDPVATPEIPGRFCSEAEKKAALDAIKPERQKAVDNAWTAANFRFDVSQAQLHGRGDAATLARMHAQATEDMRAWDAKSDALDKLWRDTLAKPVVDCSERAASDEFGASKPWSNVNLNLAGVYFRQDLPSHNGGLGVVDVGGAERDLIDLDESVDGGGVQAGVFIPDLGPQLFGLPTHVIVNGLYARGESDGRQTFDPIVGVVNGITWWDEQGGVSGISASGSGLDGSYDFRLQAFELSGGLKGAMPCWDDEDGPPRLFPRLFGGSELLWEAGAGFSWNEQSSTTWVQLFNPNPAFSVFDVTSRAHVDLTQWRGFVNTGLYFMRPIPQVPGLITTFGARANVGFFDASAHGREMNACDVEFAGAPGVNQCNPAVVDFELRSRPADSGVDAGLGFSARVDWKVPQLPGLAIGATYDLDWGSVARFKAPTNLTEDGSPHLSRRYEVGQRFGLSVWWGF
jgi:hypothetical protein